MRFHFWLVIVWALLATSGIAAVQAEEAATKPAAADAGNSSETAPAENSGTDANKPAAEVFLRITRDDADRPKALETAIVSFEGKPGSEHAGCRVGLVGVIHIGDKAYYEQIDKLLAEYDVVLYELVAPDGTRIRPEDLQHRRSLLSSVQSGMKDMLNLEYQLEHIDYMAKNFRHADMSPEEFVQDMRDRGDEVWKMLARMMGAGLASQPAGGDVGILVAMMSNNRAMLLKQTMAKQLLDVDVAVAGLDDASGENTLIKGRNRKAFEVLKEELAAGKKNIAVFYGAGHLDDMAQRLEEDFQMQATAKRWLAAWDLQRN